MIRPFQPLDTISTRRSAPDATGYIIRESLRTVPSSAVRLTADLGLYRCFMDAGGGKTGPGRLFVRRIGRPLEPNVPGRIRSAGSLFLHRNPAPSRERMPLPNSCPARLAPARGTVFGYRIHGYAGRYRICCPMHAIPGIPESRAARGGWRYRTLARCVSLRPGARFSDTESPVRRSVSYLLSDTRYLRNPAPYRERMPLPELLPGASRSGPGHGFRIPIRKTVFVPFYP